MARMLLRRLAFGLMTLWILSLIVFGSTELLPGDVASAVLGQYATPEALHAIRESLGLDRPAILRYGDWLVALLHGDLGKSLASGSPIGPLIAHRLANTLFLASAAAAVAVPLGILLGALTAARSGRWLDRSVSAVALVCVSVPEFFIGYVLIVVLARLLGLLPSMAQTPPNAGLWLRLEAVGLPVITLVCAIGPYMMRMTRAAIAEVLATPYIEMAHLKGTPDWRIILSHALPNAIGPIANVVAFSLAYLVVGVVIVEVVFVYPGMGQLMVDAVAARDVPTVQACGLIFGITYVLLNTAADLAAILSNPRLRLPR